MSSVLVESANVGTPRYRAADLRARPVDFPTRGSAGKGTAQSTARKIARIAFANLFKILASSKLTANRSTRSGQPHAEFYRGESFTLRCPLRSTNIQEARSFPPRTRCYRSAAHGHHSMAPFIGCHLASARTTTSPPETNTLSQDVAHGRLPDA